MNIDLSKPLDLPCDFIARLRGIEDLCKRYEYLESLIEHSNVLSLVRDIDGYCRKHRIIGIHYTRAVPKSINLKGLLIRDGNEIRKTALIEHGHLFTQDELVQIRERWDDFFDCMQNSIRDGRIYFNFTEDALKNGGARNLLELYGGEQVNMCFEQDDPIGIKLKTIGKPIVVQCSLDPNQITSFTEDPWGKILVSSFHTLINQDAYQYDQDGYQSIVVKPDDIIDLRIL